MCRENGRVFQILSAAVCAIIFLAAGSSASANDFGVYGQYSVPDVNGLAAIGGYIKDIGVPMTWGDEFQYVYLLDSQMNAYKVEVRIRNDGGVD
ncbi:MAG: hypothetical protein U9Q07_15230, partial [Planctomycetota bacterium]|nr:hypothetical protein [Planctomycetota bacterium]